MFYIPYKNSSKNQFQSVIDSTYAIKDDNGIVGIFGTGDSRVIYIEFGKEKRDIYKYKIAFPDGFFNSDAAGYWLVTHFEGGSLDQLGLKIAKLKSNAKISKIMHLSNSEILKFKEVMDECSKKYLILNGVQDNQINSALESIGETIVFHGTQCVIS